MKQGVMIRHLLMQSPAEWIASFDVNGWVLLGAINLKLLMAGCFPLPSSAAHHHRRL
jgi:TRAP-type C4-dicarboxylate transport system permease large subunit